MIFGKIDYLNLLPFQVFMKKNLKNSAHRAAFFNKKGVPSKINRAFLRRKIDAAFISSVRSDKRECLDMGIVAKKEVRSVLVLPDENPGNDPASETSNVLAKILNARGRVVIGDSAIKEYYKEQRKIDLALEWNKKYKLPFVFAVVCTNRCHKRAKRYKKEFLKTNIKIPAYILNHKSQETGIEKKIIIDYLNVISYELGYREKRSLKKFLKLAKKI